MEKTVMIEFTESEAGYMSGKKQPVCGDHCECLQNSISKKCEKALEQLNSPQIGDKCAFWDDDKECYCIAMLCDIKNGSIFPYYAGNPNDKNQYSWQFKNCARIKKEAEF